MDRRRAFVWALLSSMLSCGESLVPAPSLEVSSIRLLESEASPAPLSRIDLQSGVPRELVVELLYDDGSRSIAPGAVKWETSDWRVVDIDNGGTLLPNRSGRAVITVSRGDVSASLACFVAGQASDAEQLTLTPRVLTLFEGESLSLQLQTGDRPVAPSEVVWESSNPSVASIDSGVVNAQSPGQTIVSATQSQTGQRSQSSVAVAPGTLVGVELSVPKAQWVVGETVQVRALRQESGGTITDLTSSLVWESLNPGVLSVSNDVGAAGRANALNAGVAIVEARSAAGTLAGTLAFDVEPLILESVDVLDSNAQLFPGQTLSLQVVGRFNDGTTRNLAPELTWTVSDPTLVEIQDGVLRGLALGSTTLTFVDPRSGLPQDIDVRVANQANFAVDQQERRLSVVTPDRRQSAWLKAAPDPLGGSDRVVIAWDYDASRGHHLGELILDLRGPALFHDVATATLRAEVLYEGIPYFAEQRSNNENFGAGTVRLATDPSQSGFVSGTFDLTVCNANLQNCPSPLTLTGEFALGFDASWGTEDNPFPIRAPISGHTVSTLPVRYVAPTFPDAQALIELNVAKEDALLRAHTITGRPLTCVETPGIEVAHCALPADGEDAVVTIENATTSDLTIDLTYGISPVSFAPAVLPVGCLVPVTGAAFEAFSSESALTLPATVGATYEITVGELSRTISAVGYTPSGVVNPFCTQALGTLPVSTFSCAVNDDQQDIRFSFSPTYTPYFFGQVVEVTVSE